MTRRCTCIDAQFQHDGFRDMIFMAGDNPNYNAQALMASLMLKW